MNCGSEKVIAKRMGDGFYTYPNMANPDKWNDWFDEHEWGFCGPNMRGLDIFELVYECEPERETLNDV